MGLASFNRRRRELAVSSHAAQNRPVEAEKVSGRMEERLESLNE